MKGTYAEQAGSCYHTLQENVQLSSVDPRWIVRKRDPVSCKCNSYLGKPGFLNHEFDSVKTWD